MEQGIHLCKACPDELRLSRGIQLSTTEPRAMNLSGPLHLLIMSRQGTAHATRQMAGEDTRKEVCGTHNQGHGTCAQRDSGNSTWVMAPEMKKHSQTRARHVQTEGIVRASKRYWVKSPGQWQRRFSCPVCLSLLLYCVLIPAASLESGGSDHAC